MRSFLSLYLDSVLRTISSVRSFLSLSPRFCVAVTFFDQLRKIDRNQEDTIGPSWCRFDQLEYVTKDLSKQSNDFLWLHLFHDVLLHLPCGQQVKRQKILILIDQFKHEYQPNEAIYWFMKHSLLRKTIDKALQTEDTNQLYTLRYFLGMI